MSTPDVDCGVKGANTKGREVNTINSYPCPSCSTPATELSAERFYECPCGTAALLLSDVSDDVDFEIAFFAHEKGINYEMVERLGAPIPGRFRVELTPQDIADFGEAAIPQYIHGQLLWVRPIPA